MTAAAEPVVPLRQALRTRAPSRTAPRAARVAALAALVIVGLFLFNRAAGRILIRFPDFEYFYKAGAWLLARGGLDGAYDVLDGGRIVPRGTIDWYLPFTHRVMTLIAWMPYTAAGLTWALLNLAATFAVLRLMGRRLMGLPAADWPVTQFVPLILLIAYWTMEYYLNQVNNFTLLMLVGSYVLWESAQGEADARRRTRRELCAGFWLGLAALIKLTPGLLLLWFGLKRQWRTVGAALLTMLLAGPLSDAIIFGPRDAADYYAGWARRAIGSGSHAGLILAQRETDWRNQGLGAVLGRWLHPTNWATHYDNEPRAEFRAEPPAYHNVLNLPLPVVALIVNALILMTLAGLIALARRPARELNVWQLRLEWSLFVLAMLWFIPVMRQYHMIWAAPAVTMIAAVVHHAGHRSRWSLLAYACIGGVVLGEIALTSKLLKAMGCTLLSIPLLALPIVVMLLTLRRDPGALGAAAAPHADIPQIAPARPAAACPPTVHA